MLVNHVICVRLDEIVRDETLVRECRECCNEDIDETRAAKVISFLVSGCDSRSWNYFVKHSSYFSLFHAGRQAASAYLLICTCKLHAFPEVQEFIDNKVLICCSLLWFSAFPMTGEMCKTHNAGQVVRQVRGEAHARRVAPAHRTQGGVEKERNGERRGDPTELRQKPAR